MTPSVSSVHRTTNWIPCLAMMGVSVISYVDRSILSVLSPTILADLHLTAQQYLFAVSVFSITYGVANLIWGHAIDRFGLSSSIVAAVTLWSLASGSHALVLGFAGLCVTRGILGFGEGATFPAGLRTVTETLPPKKRAFGLALAYSGGALGAALTPLVVIPIAAAFGWRAAFLFTTILGLIWVLVWKVLKLHESYSRRPKAYDAAPFAVLKSRGFYATTAAYGFGAMPLAFGLYAAPLYLSEVLHQSQASIGHLLWIPPLGWEAGYLFWGWLVDKRKSPILQRPVGLILALCVIGFSICLVPLLMAPWVVMLLFFVSMFAAGGFVVLSLSYGVTIHGEGDAGFIAGACVSVWSLVVGISMGVIARLFGAGMYFYCCLLTAFLPLIGTLIWLGLTLKEEHLKPEYHMVTDIPVTDTAPS